LRSRSITRNTTKHLSGPVKARALKNATAKQQPRALLRGRGRVGREKKSTPSSASERME